MLERLLAFFKGLTKAKWYGTVTLKFRDGQIFQIVKEESISPDDI